MIKNTHRMIFQWPHARKDEVI